MTAVVVDVIVKDEIDGEVVSRCRFFQKKGKVVVYECYVPLSEMPVRSSNVIHSIVSRKLFPSYPPQTAMVLFWRITAL